MKELVRVFCGCCNDLLDKGPLYSIKESEDGVSEVTYESKELKGKAYLEVKEPYVDCLGPLIDIYISGFCTLEDEDVVDTNQAGQPILGHRCMAFSYAVYADVVGLVTEEDS